MADQLTPQQKEAVENRGGTLLVSAAAGSGKTKVLVDRLLRYLTDSQKPADLDEFLIITYTKAAASELRGKIASKLSERIAQEPENKHLQKQLQMLYLTKISTIHGFCSDLLREYAYRLDIPADFRVADQHECDEIREKVMKELLEQAYEQGEEHFLAFVDSQGLGRDDRMIPQIINLVYDSSRCHLDPEDWLQKCLDNTVAEEAVDASETLWGRFLLEDLREYLDLQIHAMEHCANSLENCEGMDKPAAIFNSTISQLRHLKDAKSWDEACRARNIDYGNLRFPKNNMDPELTEQVKQVRKHCKNELEKRLRTLSEPSERVLEDLRLSGEGTKGLILLVKAFSRNYAAVKRSLRVLDFSDLEQRTLDLLLGRSRSGITAAASEIGQRFREVMVDEYQDSNGVQDAIFMSLTAERNNCFLVGDVKQSIYQFRLADPQIFLDKYHSYSSVEEAQPGTGRKVLLSHNFRSGPEVVEAVNHVFACCMSDQVGGLVYGEAEMLREGVTHTPLNTPAVELHAIEVQEDSYAEEADYTAELILQMLREGTPVRNQNGFRPIQPDDIVILLRSPNSTGDRFRQALEERGIRCSMENGMNLLHTEEIGTIRALLQTIQNPRQDIPLITLLASPIFGFTADELAILRSKKKHGYIYDALKPEDSPKVQNFLETLKILRKQAPMDHLTVLLERCFALTRLDSVYGAMPGGTARTANIRSFFQLAISFEQRGSRDLGQFLDHLETLEQKGTPAPGGSKQGCVTILSIHKSKGLEFPVVVLSNLSKRFNREDLNGQILCDSEHGIGLSVADAQNRLRYPSLAKRSIGVKREAADLSEQMRVLYVAMTRARDRLIMTYADSSLQNRLKDLALRMDLSGAQLMCRDVRCMGDWILIAAIKRMEAGQLHALGGRPGETTLSEYPWKICVSEARTDHDHASMKKPNQSVLPDGMERTLEEALQYSYPYMSATKAPSKQTATDKKGRQKDEESAEDTEAPASLKRTWRRPDFEKTHRSGTAYGTATHQAMQYLRYEQCVSPEAVREALKDLVERGYLTQEQAELVNAEKIAVFFETEIGHKLRSGTPHLREFKFSILDDGSHYGEGLAGEQVLLQGVVDCALLEDDGITVVDFKTDTVEEHTLMAAVDKYRSQIQIYADALSRIYQQKVIHRYLYFFNLDRFAEV